MCCHRGRPAAANRVTEGIKPGDPLLPPPARPALAGRKGIGLVSLLPRPLWGLLSECILNYPGNSDMFRKEQFFLNILYWSSLEVGDFQFCQNLSLYFVASGSELLVWHYLRRVCWDCSGVSAPGLNMSYPKCGGRRAFTQFLSYADKGKSAPVDLSALTLWLVFSLKRDIQNSARSPGSHFA